MLTKTNTSFNAVKYLLLSFCLLLTSQLYSQRKVKVKPEYFLQAQGGYLHDKSFIIPYRSFSIPYKGFNLVNVGGSRLKNNTLQSLQLELIKFSVERMIFSPNNPYPTAGFTGKRKSMELIYNHSFGLTRNIKKGFFIGPSASFIVNSNKVFPAIPADLPVYELCVCFGVGVNAGFNWSLNKNIMLSISSRITLLDAGRLRTEIKDPARPVSQQRSYKFHTDLIRSQYQLMIGLNFKL